MIKKEGCISFKKVAYNSYIDEYSANDNYNKINRF